MVWYVRGNVYAKDPQDMLHAFHAEQSIMGNYKLVIYRYERSRNHRLSRFVYLKTSYRKDFVLSGMTRVSTFAEAKFRRLPAKESDFAQEAQDEPLSRDVWVMKPMGAVLCNEKQMFALGQA